MTPETAKEATILLVETDVVVRFALAEFLRHCDHKVIEVSDGDEAKAVLLAGLDVNVLISDAQLAAAPNGFALAQWVRRYRPHIEVILTSTIDNKALMVTEFCGRHPGRPAPSDAARLSARIRAMLAERKRRTRPPSSSAMHGVRRRRMP